MMVSPGIRGALRPAGRFRPDEKTSSSPDIHRNAHYVHPFSVFPREVDFATFFINKSVGIVETGIRIYNEVHLYLPGKHIVIAYPKRKRIAPPSACAIGTGGIVDKKDAPVPQRRSLTLFDGFGMVLRSSGDHVSPLSVEQLCHSQPSHHSRHHDQAAI